MRALVFALCLASAAAWAAADGPVTGLIPLPWLVHQPLRSDLALSPDGTRVAYVGGLRGRRLVWWASVSSPENERPVELPNDLTFVSYAWAGGGKYLLLTVKSAITARRHLVRLELDTGQAAVVAGAVDGQPIGHLASAALPDALAVLFRRDTGEVDLHRVDIRSGQAEVLMRDVSAEQIQLDSELNPALLIRTSTAGRTQYVDATNGRAVLETSLEEALSKPVVAFDRDADAAYVCVANGAPTTGVWRLAWPTGEETLVAAEPDEEMVALLPRYRDGGLWAAASRRDRLSWRAISAEFAEHAGALAAYSDGDVEIVSRDYDDARWLVHFLQDDRPGEYCVYDLNERRVLPLFADRPQLVGQVLSRMVPVTFTARDEFGLRAYLSLPPTAEVEADGRPIARLPTVIVVDSPWRRAAWGFDWTHQLFTNRGYAVLRVELRGTSGYGRSYLTAGSREAAGKAIDDLLDSIQWALDVGIADPAHVAVLGFGFGGLAALQAAARTPELIAAVAAIGPPLDLLALATRPAAENRSAFAALRLGFGEDVADLAAASPIHRPLRIGQPLLLVGGADGGLTKPAALRAYALDLDAAQVEVTYLEFVGEAFPFVHPTNEASLACALEWFLATKLGGRARHIGACHERDQSSGIAVVGGTRVSGVLMMSLPTALRALPVAQDPHPQLTGELLQRLGDRAQLRAWGRLSDELRERWAEGDGLADSWFERWSRAEQLAFLHDEPADAGGAVREYYRTQSMGAEAFLVVEWDADGRLRFFTGGPG